MLVFAAAGLDSLLKQLIRDALGELATKDTDVQRELEAFVSRTIRGDKGSGDGEAGSSKDHAQPRQARCRGTDSHGRRVLSRARVRASAAGSPRFIVC
jgi:hypothetical protein